MAIAVAASGFVVGRMTVPHVAPAPAAEPVPALAPVVVPTPPRIDVARKLNRADLLDLANRAADAFASGVPVPTEVVNAAGRRFDVVLPFGCEGAASAASTAPLRWRYDADRQTLRIHVAPIRWEAHDWAAPAADKAGVMFEGFWMSRPWSSAEQCPHAREEAAATPDQSIVGSDETLALAEILPEEGRRSARPFETVQRMSPDRFSSAQGFRLRVAGRIERLPGADLVRCIQPAGSEQRPICLIAVTFDDIRLENPMGGETLAIWSMHRTLRAVP
ncbi:MAG TPA: hypothetical protein VNS79_10870 [Sphingobium sp.]|nr:hypothetical protein [Sphingobium sp.]